MTRGGPRKNLIPGSKEKSGKKMVKGKNDSEGDEIKETLPLKGEGWDGKRDREDFWGRGGEKKSKISGVSEGFRLIRGWLGGCRRWLWFNRGLLGGGVR